MSWQERIRPKNRSEVGCYSLVLAIGFLIVFAVVPVMGKAVLLGAVLAGLITIIMYPVWQDVRAAHPEAKITFLLKSTVSHVFRYWQTEKLLNFLKSIGVLVIALFALQGVGSLIAYRHASAQIQKSIEAGIAGYFDPTLSHNNTFFRLSAIPPAIGELRGIEELYATQQRISILPPEVGNLTNLTHLNLWQNHLTSLPPEIKSLRQLTFLYLVDNRLRELPPEIGYLTQLQSLHLDSNYLTSIPPEIGQLSNLEVLYLHDNKLTELPPEIGELTNLRVLDLRDNDLTTLPGELSNLQNLKHLYITGNKIEEIPFELQQKSDLEIWQD